MPPSFAIAVSVRGVYHRMTDSSLNRNHGLFFSHDSKKKKKPSTSINTQNVVEDNMVFFFSRLSNRRTEQDNILPMHKEIMADADNNAHTK